MAALECGRQVGLDLRNQSDAVIDECAVELQQGCAGLDLGDGRGAGVDAADADDGERALPPHKSLGEHTRGEFEQRPT